MAESDSGLPLGLDCPNCNDRVMLPPIFQCQTGHSLCSKCYNKLKKKICPTPNCCQIIINTPNVGLQNLIEQLQISCPYEEAGCKLKVKAVEKFNNVGHVEECIFRTLKCPFTIFGKCSWTGKLKTMMDHCKERHLKRCHFDPDEDTILEDINFNSDERIIKIFALRDRVFFLTFKIDLTAGLAYWTVQHYASKDFAQTWVYHLQLISTYDSDRKLKFIEHCFYDVRYTDEIFTSLQCAVIPLNYLKTFVKNGELKFNFKVLNLTYVPKKYEKPVAAPKDGETLDKKNQTDKSNGKGKFKNLLE